MNEEYTEYMEYMQFVPQAKFELIPIKNLVSNQDYQRNLSVKHVQKAASHFDLFQINPVKVSRRGGINYVFNGQHTIEIVALVSDSRETPVWCMVYENLEYMKEADIFANQMKYTKPLSPYEIFMANIEAGSDDQIIIRDLVESYGLQISAGSGPGNICAVGSLEFIYNKYGYQTLERTLSLDIGTWEGVPQSLSANMIKGIARLIATYGTELKDETFKEKLSVVSCKEITRTAKERRSGSLGFAEALLICYNKKSRFGLEWSKLYTKKKGAILPPEAAAQAARADEEEENEDMTVEEENAQAEQLNLFSMDQ